jgi:biopolymer transport protein TolR
MAASLPGMGERRGRRRRRYVPISEINVTPLVDVMLVLLIVFMISAPLLSVGVPVDLPESPANPLATEREPITITVNADGRIFLQENEVTIDEVVPRLIQEATSGLDERIYIRGDRASSYGAMMKVMGTINAAGFRRIGLVALPEEG